MNREEAPSFSVIIPTLNEARNIGPLLESLQQQTLAPREIIVADGGSHDNTVEIARSFSQVLVVQCERGVSRQRNTGARHASGDFLVFLDADDRAAPAFLESVARSNRRLPFAVACPWFTVRERDFGIRAAYLAFNFLFFLGQGWLRMGSGVGIVVRRAVFESIGGFDEGLHLGEDIHLIRRASRHGLHRHLLVPLETSGRRYQKEGMWKLSAFYLRITPLLVLGLWKYLQSHRYAPISEPEAPSST